MCRQPFNRHYNFCQIANYRLYSDFRQPDAIGGVSRGYKDGRMSDMMATWSGLLLLERVNPFNLNHTQYLFWLRLKSFRFIHCSIRWIVWFSWLQHVLKTFRSSSERFLDFFSFRSKMRREIKNEFGGFRLATVSQEIPHQKRPKTTRSIDICIH